jgi:hypothetical protein
VPPPNEQGQKYWLTLTGERAEILRELCTEELAKRGFDENYGPTAAGQTLENLIDKLFEP